MWEAIQTNQRRSMLLVGLMGAVLVALGYAVGMIVNPEIGGMLGAAGALALWLILLAIAFLGGDQVLLQSAGAKRIAKEDAPQLWNVVEEMTIASGLGRMPEVYIVERDSPNAFAVGRHIDRAAVAVTSGLLSRLNRDELQGVVAHEIAHLHNRDVLFMTLAAVMMGSTVLISDFFLRSMRYGRRFSGRGGKGGQAQVAIFLVALILAVLAPICAQLLYLACSRRREYLADASGARFTRYPEGLASALEKIAASAPPVWEVNRALAALCIVNPLQATDASSLFSTHPPVEARIKILRSMAGGASYAEYEAAYQRVLGRRQRCIGIRTLAASERHVAVRAASVEAEPRQVAVERARAVGNLLGRLGGFLTLTCGCGVGIKVPPDSQLDSIPCPRCGRVNTLPVAVPAAAPARPEAALQSPLGGIEGGKAPALRYERRGEGWESFKCSCGKVLQLSPSHLAPSVRCSGCRREIDIVRAESMTEGP